MHRAPRPANEEERLAALSSFQLLHTEPEAAFDDISRLAAQICDAPMASITLVGRDEQFFKSELNLGTKGSARDDSICTWAILERDVFIVEDTLEDERFRENPFVTSGPRLRFYAGVPLTMPDGYTLGTLCVFDNKPRRLTGLQVESLRTLARQAVMQMQLRLQVLTETRRAEALRTAEKLAVAGRLASSMAHEINNPLQSVTNLLFMSSLTADEVTKRHLELAQEELARVTHIVTQTLRFHQQAERPAPVRFADLAESVGKLFSTRLRHAGASFDVIDRQGEPLIAKAGDLRQVFANLIGNALDAVAIRQGTGRIVFRVRDARDPVTAARGVRVTIADNGCGMDMETREHLFEPFYSTKGARGTGLGLWVSRGILDQHGATLRFWSSDCGRLCGTSFSLFFPADGLERAEARRETLTSEAVELLDGPRPLFC